MPSEPRFTGHFRRPNETGPGVEITLSIGETVTRFSLGDDILGSWPNSVIDLQNRSPLTLRILDETWLVSMPDPSAFLQVAEARFCQETAAEPAPEPEAAPVGEPRRSEPRNEPDSDPPLLSSSAPRILWSRLTLPRSARSWGRVTAALVLLVAAFTFEGPLATVGAVAAGAVAVLTVSAVQRERDQRGAPPRASLATADIEAQFARALGSAIGKSHQTPASGGDIDDLMSVRGIGRQYAHVLISAGVSSLEQLANLTPIQRKQTERALGAQGERLGRERWAEQAAKIVEERRKSSGRRIR